MGQEVRINRAWILDAMPHREGVEIWFKLPTGKIMHGVYPHQPSFYATFRATQHRDNFFPSDDEKYQYYATRLAEHEFISSVEVVKRRVLAKHTFFSLCLKVTPLSPFKFKKAIKVLKHFETFEFYSSDIPLVQIFFYETGLFPFASCRFSMIHKLGKRDLYIDKIDLTDSNELIDYPLPPLRIVWLDIFAKSMGIKRETSDILLKCTLTVDPDSSPLDLTNLFPPDMISTDVHNYPQVQIAEGSEYDTLLMLEKAIKILDPDIIFTSKGDERIFPYLMARIKQNRLDRHFSLSRNGTPLRYSKFELGGSDSYMSYGRTIHRASTQFYLQGRLHIDSAIMGGLHFSGGNLYGIVEVARISYVTLQRLTRVTIGGALQSMQFFHAYNQSILIPEEKKNVEYFREAANLLKSDRGGLILNPVVGMFDRVAELDFTSMYPALMVKYNVSPEKVNCDCCESGGNIVPGLPYHTCTRGEGIVPLSLQLPLTKRIRYKELIKISDPTNAKRYENIQGALKWILVVCFGYLGFKNARFGRIEAHQAVCAYSREFLLNAMDIVEKHGLRYLHGIVDSLYVQAPKSMKTEEFHQICHRITLEIVEKTKIPINYDPKTNFFQFLTFLPTKAQPEIGALNRYWGVKPDGKIKVRGVELRRHDAPPFVKDFQHELITAIGISPYRQHWKKLLRGTILPLLERYFKKLDTRTVSIDELAITIRLTRRLSEYKVNIYQSIAARHLARHGLYLGPGQKISFIITNDRAKNPMDKALPIQLFKKRKAVYDVRKYRQLLVRALNNLLPNPLTSAEMKQLVEYSSDSHYMIQKTQKSLLEYIHI
ncbi:MAG: DNA polymerase domain-containing protein [Promethearchaeota archaeon]